MSPSLTAATNNVILNGAADSSSTTIFVPIWVVVLTLAVIVLGFAWAMKSITKY